MFLQYSINVCICYLLIYLAIRFATKEILKTEVDVNWNNVVFITIQ